MSRARGLVIAAPQSGCGKTVFTLGLLRALARAGHAVAAAKSGPDYIDPKFQEAASGAECINLDAWAMRPEAIRARAAAHAAPASLMVIEGAMGLFDGAASGAGSTADLAALLGLPVVLVVDAARQAQSVAALVKGFASFRADTRIAGIVLNRVGSARHEAMLRRALGATGIDIVGALSADPALSLPSRHLGLVQAAENPDLEAFVDRAAAKVEQESDLAALSALAAPLAEVAAPHAPFPAPGRAIAVARDVAFSFLYPHMLRDWRSLGCRIDFFSPLADEAPPDDCDAIWLPGGYPELWAADIANAGTFRAAIRAAAERGVPIYGECGGYMVLGERLTDAAGTAHAMLGLLPLETSFAERRRQLGYRLLQPCPGAPWNARLAAHEFHYATVVREAGARPLFSAEDSEGTALGTMGLRRGNVCGSFAHLIDCS